VNNLSKRNPQANDFRALIIDLSTLIEHGRRVALRRINAALTAASWLVGRRIVKYEQKGKERAAYGDQLLKNVSERLSLRHGKGFDERNLRNMRKFYLTYPEIRYTLCTKLGHPRTDIHQFFEALSEKFLLSWSHYRLLIFLDDAQKRKFYEAECRRGNWSVRQLDRQIQSMLYERTGLSKRKDLTLARAHENPIVTRPEDEIKDPYILDFLDLKDDYSESDLEDALIKHLEKFLLEIGSGFTFVARQKRFCVGGKDCKIDLMLFNRIWKALLLIDLKISEFTHGDAGQMNFYLNWAKKEAKLAGENDPVGLIMCSGKNKPYVQYALGGMSNKIFVSQYKLQLPKPEKLRQELERGKALFLERKTQESIRAKTVT